MVQAKKKLEGLISNYMTKWEEQLDILIKEKTQLLLTNGDILWLEENKEDIEQIKQFIKDNFIPKDELKEWVENKEDKTWKSDAPDLVKSGRVEVIMELKDLIDKI